MRPGIARLHPERAAKQRLRLLVPPAVDPVDEIERPDHQPPGVDAVGLRVRGPEAFLRVKVRLDGGDDPLGDVVLDREDVAQLAVVAFGPDMLAGLRVDELARDPEPLPGRPDAALEHVAHPEIARDLADIHGPALVDEGRVARDHEEPAQPRERGDDVLAQSVGEEILRGIAAEIGERQDRDRGSGERLDRLAAALGLGRRSGRIAEHRPQDEAGMALDDRERPVGEEAGEQLVDRRFPELGAKGELVARDMLPRDVILDGRRHPPTAVHDPRAPSGMRPAMFSGKMRQDPARAPETARL
jgi:hypothetical protein